MSGIIRAIEMDTDGETPEILLESRLSLLVLVPVNLTGDLGIQSKNTSGTWNWILKNDGSYDIVGVAEPGAGWASYGGWYQIDEVYNSITIRLKAHDGSGGDQVQGAARSLEFQTKGVGV